MEYQLRIPPGTIIIIFSCISDTLYKKKVKRFGLDYLLQGFHTKISYKGIFSVINTLSKGTIE